LSPKAVLHAVKNAGMRLALQGMIDLKKKVLQFHWPLKMGRVWKAECYCAGRNVRL
jgi:hypothetical protein